MNKNALRVEMDIPLLAHPKHTYTKIDGLTDSDSEYSYDKEDELDDLIQYSKEVESNSTKNSKPDQDSLPNLVIYATPQRRTVHLEETHAQALKALSTANKSPFPARHPDRPISKETRPRSSGSLPRNPHGSHL